MRLQALVIGDARFVTLGLRREGGFVGEHDRTTRMPILEHLSARPDDLPSLIDGLIECERGPARTLYAGVQRRRRERHQRFLPLLRRNPPRVVRFAPASRRPSRTTSRPRRPSCATTTRSERTPNSSSTCRSEPSTSCSGSSARTAVTCHSARTKAFAVLSNEEVARIEAAYASTFGAAGA